MKLIVLTGLVAYEKAILAAQIAQQLADSDLRVTVIDNSNQKQVSEISGVDVVRIAGGCVCCSLPSRLYKEMYLIGRRDMDAVVLVASESANPEALMVVLDNLSGGQPGLDVHIISLVDERTTACFPHLDNLLRDYAKVTLEPPYRVEEALAIL